MKTPFALAVVLVACAHAHVEPPPSTAMPTSAVIEPGAAHGVVIDATACWFGGTWNEAIGDRDALPRSRCASALARAFDGPLDTMRLERLREAEPGVVNELSERVQAMAASEFADRERAESLAVLLRAIGAAEDEHIRARRTAVRVQIGFEGARAAARDLSSASALEALFKVDAGELTPEARTIAIMIAADRIGLAVDLPRPLKVLVVERAIELLFDLHPPPMSADPAEDLALGAWLSYLEDIAAAAGHPVPPYVAPLAQRERLAWAGMLEGIATKLRIRTDTIPSPSELTRAAAGMTNRLENECKRDQP